MMDDRNIAETESGVSRWHAWMICAISFMVQFVAISFFGSFGPMYVELLRVFKAGDAITAWVPSMAFSISYLISPLIYPLCDRIGFRLSMFLGALLFGLGIFTSSFAASINTLYFTIGIMIAVGHSLCQASSMFILPHYFGENWSLPLGIALSGSGFGSLAFSSIKALLFDKYGYKTGMQLLSAAAIPLALGGLTFKKRKKKPPSSNAEESPAIEDRYPPLARNKAFLMLLVCSFCFHTVYLITYVHLTRLAGDMGISDTNSALLPGVLAISESAGKIFIGKVLAHCSPKSIGLYQTSWIGIAIAYFLCPFATQFYGLVLYSSLWGFSIGNASGMTVYVIQCIVGSRNVIKGYSIFLMCFSPASLIGPPVAGWIRERTSSYATAFYLSGGIVTFASSALFLVTFLHNKNKKQFEENQSQRILNDGKDEEKKILHESDSHSEIDEIITNKDSILKNSEELSQHFFFNMENSYEQPTNIKLCLERNLRKDPLYIDRETSL